MPSAPPSLGATDHVVEPTGGRCLPWRSLTLAEELAGQGSLRRAWIGRDQGTTVWPLKILYA
jgi:hypothetical protein